MRIRHWSPLPYALLFSASLACQAHSPDAPGESTPQENTPHDSTNAADDSPLPSAFKGYELYAWEDQGALSYTLVTGTNRLKTVAEITASTDSVTSGEWIFVRGQGMSNLKALLARVPEGTSVILTDLEGLAPLSEATRKEISGALPAP